MNKTNQSKGVALLFNVFLGQIGGEYFYTKDFILGFARNIPWLFGLIVLILKMSRPENINPVLPTFEVLFYFTFLLTLIWILITSIDLIVSILDDKKPITFRKDDWEPTTQQDVMITYGVLIFFTISFTITSYYGPPKFEWILR